jgi:hypothetical protein
MGVVSARVCSQNSAEPCADTVRDGALSRWEAAERPTGFQRSDVGEYLLLRILNAERRVLLLPQCPQLASAMPRNTANFQCPLIGRILCNRLVRETPARQHESFSALSSGESSAT